MFRSCRPEVFCKKGVLRNFVKFTKKRLCQSLFFNKFAGLRPATLLKKRLLQRCFLVNFTKFLRTLFYRTPLDDRFRMMHVSELLLSQWISPFQIKLISFISVFNIKRSNQFTLTIINVYVLSFNAPGIFFCNLVGLC